MGHISGVYFQTKYLRSTRVGEFATKLTKPWITIFLSIFCYWGYGQDIKMCQIYSSNYQTKIVPLSDIFFEISRYVRDILRYVWDGFVEVAMFTK